MRRKNGRKSCFGFNPCDDSCGYSFNQSDDIISRSPLLGPLADNGGPTLTFMPQPDSPAINNGTMAEQTKDSVAELEEKSLLLLE